MFKSCGGEKCSARVGPRETWLARTTGEGRGERPCRPRYDSEWTYSAEGQGESVDVISRDASHARGLGEQDGAPGLKELRGSVLWPELLYIGGCGDCRSVLILDVKTHGKPLWGLQQGGAKRRCSVSSWLHFGTSAGEHSLTSTTVFFTLLLSSGLRALLLTH